MERLCPARPRITAQLGADHVSVMHKRGGYPPTPSVRAPGHAIDPSRSLSGSACRSWRREVMSSLVKTLARWYSTVRGLRNSWAAISGFDRRARARLAIWAS
jgi:hypothetical protein